MKKILKWIISRQAAQHGSVTALAIGTIASLLGIPLAPEQISAIIAAISVVTYIISQVKASKNEPNVQHTSN